MKCATYTYITMPMQAVLHIHFQHLFDSFR